MNNIGDIVGYDSNGVYISRNGVKQHLALTDVWGINDLGQIIGATYETVPWSDGVSFATRLKRAAVYSNSLGVRLVGPPLWQSPGISGLTAVSSIGTAINASGQIVGAKVPFPTVEGGSTRAWLGSVDGSFLDLGPVPWFPANTKDVDIRSINSHGWVAGTATTNEVVTAFVYRNGQFVNLSPNLYAWAQGINDFGQVVGSQYSFRLSLNRATLWEGGSTYDLNDLIPRNSGWNLDWAYAINNEGRIVGVGTYQGRIEQHALLLTPTSQSVYYYGLGDSVASGHGLRAATGPCLQSPDSYPRKVAENIVGLGVVDRGGSYVDPAGQVRYFACSGANTTNTVAPPAKNLSGQIDAVLDDFSLRRRGNPGMQLRSLLSITIGANDFPWSTLDGMGQFLCQSDQELERRAGEVLMRFRTGLLGQLSRLVAVDGTQVILTEYHDPFNRDSNILRLARLRGPCEQNRVTLNDMQRRVTSLLSKLNQAIADVASGFSKGRVDMARVNFQGHESPRFICGAAPPDADRSWVQGPFDLQGAGNVITRGDDCSHPNDIGAVVFSREVASVARQMLSR